MLNLDDDMNNFRLMCKWYTVKNRTQPPRAGLIFPLHGDSTINLLRNGPLGNVDTWLLTCNPRPLGQSVWSCSQWQISPGIVPLFLSDATQYHTVQTLLSVITPVHITANIKRNGSYDPPKAVLVMKISWETAENHVIKHDKFPTCLFSYNQWQHNGSTGRFLM